jgi:prepilin-type N-terminal cleavage/methylation domain-containing protein
MSLRNRNRGFTIVELLIVIIVIGILATLVITTYNGIQAGARDTKRKTDINAVQGQVEAYNTQNGKYPTSGNMNDATFRTNNMKGLDAKALQDPKWDSGNTNCTASGNVTLQNSAAPGTGCYGYTASATGGGACDNTTVDCATYVITANLEKGPPNTYVKTGSN